MVEYGDCMMKYLCRCGCGRKFRFVYFALTHELFFCKFRNDKSHWLSENEIQKYYSKL